MGHTVWLQLTASSRLACAQDKDAKVAYLKKIIEVVQIVCGEACPAKPNKVRCPTLSTVSAPATTG